VEIIYNLQSLLNTLMHFQCSFSQELCMSLFIEYLLFLQIILEFLTKCHSFVQNIPLHYRFCTSFEIQIFVCASRKVLILLTLLTQDWIICTSHGKIWILCRHTFIAILWSGQVINQAMSVECVRLIKEGTEGHNQSTFPIYYCILPAHVSWHEFLFSCTCY
jgi:hypothetical protein